jgi:hypothetical protein
VLFLHSWKKIGASTLGYNTPCVSVAMAVAFT